ncbi:MAG: hypothetical protein ACTHZ5_01070 [Micrococcaceae bacterium]
MRGIPVALGVTTAALVTVIGLTEPPLLWVLCLPLLAVMVVLGRRFDQKLERTPEKYSGGSLFAMTAVFVTMPLVFLRGAEGAAYVFPALGVLFGVGVWWYFRRLAQVPQ